MVVGLSDTGGWLYLGRAEGRFGRKEPCSVTTENGKIKQFFYPDGKEKRFESVVGDPCPYKRRYILTFLKSHNGTIAFLGFLVLSEAKCLLVFALETCKTI